MNFRPSTLLWMLCLACGFVGLYMLKYKVQSVKSEVASVERQLMEEKRNLHVLEAEWSYLNRPDRLAALSGKYLHMNSLQGKQLADFSVLPLGNPGAVMQQAVAAAEKKPSAGGRSVALAGGAGHER